MPFEEQFCYLTTTGRRTGRAHTIEIWFAADGRTLYLGGSPRSDWVKNLMVDAAVSVRVGAEEVPATARVLDGGTEEDERARRLLLEKYQAPGDHDLDSWGRTALIVAVDV
ncbi:MAG: nitroreductase family deazaflavin-dependent oxidoreductase [Actinomycetota bacterium]|nr:nitroreductase family deazaflavin-dependent oxidoreductase [Actinomycetota bacterium]